MLLPVHLIIVHD